MRTNSHNALNVKRKLAPSDYNAAKDCTFINVTTGKRTKIPALLVRALREGKVRLVQ